MLGWTGSDDEKLAAQTGSRERSKDAYAKLYSYHDDCDAQRTVYGTVTMGGRFDSLARLLRVYNIAYEWTLPYLCMQML